MSDRAFVFFSHNLIYYKDQILLHYHGHEVDKYKIYLSNSENAKNFSFEIDLVKKYFYHSISFMDQLKYNNDKFIIMSPNSRNIEIVKLENKIHKIDEIELDRGKALSVIDNLNGDIILLQKFRKIVTLKIYSKFDYIYELKYIIKEKYHKLYNIIDNCFCACTPQKTDIYGYNNENYVLKKSFRGDFSFLGTIDNKYFILRDNLHLFLINLFYYEIVQKIEDNNSIRLFLINDTLLQIIKIDSNKLKIKISKFDLIEGDFRVSEKKEENVFSIYFWNLVYLGKDVQSDKDLVLLLTSFYDRILIKV